MELRVLQYGVTRDSLPDVLEQGEGWDVIHFSGHGQPGSLLLERPMAVRTRFQIGVRGLLRHSGGRLKLVTLSACLSAAASIEQTLSWLAPRTGGGARPARASRDSADPEAGADGRAGADRGAGLRGRWRCATRSRTSSRWCWRANCTTGCSARSSALPQAKADGAGQRCRRQGGAAWARLSAAAPALFGPRPPT